MYRKSPDVDRPPLSAAVKGIPESSRRRSSHDLAEHPISEWALMSIFDWVDQHKINQTLWQDYEIPRELCLIQAGTPFEIRRIVKISLDNHRVHRGDPVKCRISGAGDTKIAEPAMQPGLDLPSQDGNNQRRSRRLTVDVSDSSVLSFPADGESNAARSSVSSVSSAEPRVQSGSQMVPPKPTIGKTRMSIGSLGQIVTNEEGPKPESWWRRHKGLKKTNLAMVDLNQHPNGPGTNGYAELICFSCC